jgi:hypothetical protein
MSISASYPSVMAGIGEILQQLFPGIQCYHSEQAALPWSVARLVAPQAGVPEGEAS